MMPQDLDIEKLYFKEVISVLGYNFKNYSSLESDMSESRSVNYGIDCIGKDEKFKPKKSTFVHFTNLKSLTSILTEKSIRLYNVNGMNDISEINHYSEKYKVSSETIRQFKDNVFIMSSCSSDILDTEDELTLWRLYGNEGNGCCIEFEFIQESYSTNLHRYNIVYADNYDDKIDVFFDKHNEFHEKYKPFNINADKFILDLSVFHKSKHFKIEKEERLFCCKYPNEFKEIFWDFNSKNKFVSYVKIPLNYSVNKKYFESSNITPRIKIKKIIFGHKISKLNKNEEVNLLSKYFNSDKDLPIIGYSPLTFYN